MINFACYVRSDCGRVLLGLVAAVVISHLEHASAELNPLELQPVQGMIGGKSSSSGIIADHIGCIANLHPHVGL